MVYTWHKITEKSGVMEMRYGRGFADNNRGWFCLE